MNKELKTLFIGFYDYPYSCDAYIFENKSFHDIHIDDELYDLLNDISCRIICEKNFKLTKEKLEDLYIDSFNIDEKVNNAIKLINKLFETYKNVVICDDGDYTFFDKTMVEELL